MLYDVFNLDVMHEPGPVEAKPEITLFSARLENGVMTIPAWSEVKRYVGGVA